jgi:hypothetical protein
LRCFPIYKNSVLLSPVDNFCGLHAASRALLKAVITAPDPIEFNSTGQLSRVGSGAKIMALASACIIQIFVIREQMLMPADGDHRLQTSVGLNY